METKKKVGIAAVILTALALLFFWVKKAKADGGGGGGGGGEKATLWGIVSDATTGSPVAGINVALNSLSTTTDSAGKYEFLNIEPGTYASLTFTDPQGRYETLVLTEAFS